MQRDGGNTPGDGMGADTDPSLGPKAPHEPAAPPQVRLRREFKGLTVRDLLADAGLDDQLPGAARSALAHIERGDLVAAEAVLPGHFAPVLPGPGRDRVRRRRRRIVWITFVALAVAATTATIQLL